MDPLYVCMCVCLRLVRAAGAKGDERGAQDAAEAAGARPPWPDAAADRPRHQHRHRHPGDEGCPHREPGARGRPAGG